MNHNPAMTTSVGKSNREPIPSRKGLVPTLMRMKSEWVISIKNVEDKGKGVLSKHKLR